MSDHAPVDPRTDDAVPKVVDAAHFFPPAAPETETDAPKDFKGAFALTAAAAGAALSLSESAFRRLVRTGNAPTPIFLGSCSSPRWRADELRAWVNAGAPRVEKWTWKGESNVSE